MAGLLLASIGNVFLAYVVVGWLPSILPVSAAEGAEKLSWPLVLVFLIPPSQLAIQGALAKPGRPNRTAALLGYLGSAALVVQAISMRLTIARVGGVGNLGVIIPIEVPLVLYIGFMSWSLGLLASLGIKAWFSCISFSPEIPVVRWGWVLTAAVFVYGVTGTVLYPRTGTFLALPLILIGAIIYAVGQVVVRTRPTERWTPLTGDIERYFDPSQSIWHLNLAEKVTAAGFAFLVWNICTPTLDSWIAALLGLLVGYGGVLTERALLRRKWAKGRRTQSEDADGA